MKVNVKAIMRAMATLFVLGLGVELTNLIPYVEPHTALLGVIVGSYAYKPVHDLFNKVKGLRDQD